MSWIKRNEHSKCNSQCIPQLAYHPHKQSKRKIKNVQIIKMKVKVTAVLFSIKRKQKEKVLLLPLLQWG